MNSPAADRRVSTLTAVSYGAGEFGLNLTWNMLLGFGLFYYSNVAFLPVAAIGTMMLLSRSLDAIVDPLVGILVDKTRTRLGRARPFILAAIVPHAILIVLTFSVPDWSPDAKLIYAYVTFFLAGLLYSFVYIPYNALLPLITSDPQDKLRLGSMRSMGSSVGSILLYSSVMALVVWIGGGDSQKGFTAASSVMAIGAIICMMIVFWNCQERPARDSSADAGSLRTGIRDMVRNPTWLIVSGFGLVMFIRLGSLVSVTAYFANDVLRNPAAIALLLSSLSFSILVGGALARFFLGYFGKRRGNILALSFSLLMTLLMFLFKDQYWVFGTLYVVGNVALGIQAATIFTMMADAVDTQERLVGRRNEGLLSSSVSFGMKMGMAIGGSLIAYGLAFADYDPKAVTEGAREMIELMYFGAPALFAALQIIIISFLTPERAR